MGGHSRIVWSGAVPELRPIGRSTSLKLSAQDALDAVLRRRDPLVPPRRLHPPGNGGFAAAGERELGLLIGLGKVRPDERVLDVRCGLGIRARPLSDYLGPGATYDGIDTDERAVAWCERAYRHRPDFAFHHLAGPDARWPLADGSVDLVLLMGALDGLAPDAVVGQLAEARRVLVDDGRAFLTAFLLDDDARAALAAGTAAHAFSDSDGISASCGELVAFEEEWLLDRIADAGFRRAGIRHGTWTPRDAGRAHEDIVVARL